MTLTAKSGDDAVAKWAAIYGDDYAKRLEPVIRSTFDSYKMTHDLKAAKEARDSAKDERDRDMWDLRVRSLETSIRNTESLINDRETRGHKPKKLPEGSGPDAILDAVGDDTIDQVALRRTANTHLTNIATKMQHNVARARVLDSEIGVLTRAKYLTDAQKEQLDAKKTQRANLAEENQRLFDTKERLRAVGFGGSGSLVPLRKVAPGQLLSKDDALRKLQQQP
jgi:hypothetical protein